jgi:hypothetical protein
MKTHLVGLFSVMFFLSGCATAPVSTPFPVVDATQVPDIVAPIIFTATVSVLPTFTATPPISTTTPSERNGSDFELPPDCSIYDSSIDLTYYHDLSDGACDHPSLSPDGSFIAFASLTKAHSESGLERIVQEAKLFSKSLSQSYSIYASKCGILYPEWTPAGFLVISDFPQDVGCGYTVVFDTTKNEIITTLEGAVRKSQRNYWSADKNSFFTLSPDLFGPECSETLSGFDLISNKPVPVIVPITPNTSLYVVIGNPTWTQDNNNLFAVIRDGNCLDEEKYECTYSNSYIVSIDFVGATPKISYPYYDPEIDYSFTKSQNGNLEINSTPAKTINCWDVHLEESK